MYRLKITFIFILAISGYSFAQEQKQEPEFKLKKYYFVMLKRGPNKSIDSLKLQEIQKGHIANLNRLAEEKKLIIAGPFGDDTDWRGILILNVDTMEEAKKLTETDPAIKIGRLVAEIHPWYSEPGACLE